MSVLSFILICQWNVNFPLRLRGGLRNALKSTFAKMLARLGRRQAEMVAYFVPSALAFGGAGFCGLLYFTDWKLFVTYIPFYAGKFKDHETD